jgi:type III secretion protein J
MLLTLLLLTAGCSKLHLQGGLSEQDAQEIVVVLKENGLDAVLEREAGESKEGPKFAVKVKGGDQNLVLAWRVLRENGLPREKEKGLADVFAGGGMIPTAAEEKARLLVGLAGEISRTLRSLEGVADARVHVVLPENSPLLERSQWKPTTASVLLKHTTPQPPLTEAQVKALVAKGVEGLENDQVAVVFKKVEIKPQPPRDVAWYLGNQEVLIAALTLLALTSVTSLALVARARVLRAKVEALERRLESATVARSSAPTGVS